MTMNSQGFCSTAIEFMSMEGLRELCTSISGQKVILIMSKTAAARYQWESLIGQLQAQCELLWIQENVAYPTQQTLLMGIEKLKGFDADLILAVGGGSSIDFAKGLKAFYGAKESCTLELITEYLEAKRISTGKDIRIIAVPTTAGTGSELTQWATIWDYQKKCKYSLDHPLLKPDKAVIVPEFTLEADQGLTIATGLDALAHAIEAYWSKKSNPLVRSLAGEAIRTNVSYLPRILQEPKSLLYREKQCLASVLSGLAFSATRTTACHSISYSLTMDYGIPHGIAVAMTLDQVAARNKGHYQEEEMMECFRPYSSIREYLCFVCEGRISLHLKDYGIHEEDISSIAKKSFTLGRMDNNPVNLTVMEVEEILQEIYS